MEPFDLTTTWDDGEIEWDVDEDKEYNTNKNIYVITKLRPYISVFDTTAINVEPITMDDGEISWESINVEKENIYMVTEKEQIWSYIDNYLLQKQKRKEKMKRILTQIYDELFTSDNLMSDLIDITEEFNTTMEFQIVLTSFVLLLQIKNVNRSLFSEPSVINTNDYQHISILAFAFLFVFTKGVHSAF
jgi:hypothetical protein